MVKIAHIADIHLNSPLSGLLNIEKAAKRRNEAFQTFERALELCREQGAQIVLLAGDMFDDKDIGRGDFLRFCAAIQNAPEIYFFLAAGNHDHARQGSLYRLHDIPKNLKIFLEPKIERVVLEELKTVVYGAGFDDEETKEPILSNFRAGGDEGYTRLMVIHGDAFSSNSPYNPISAAMIGASGLHYIALGHVHQRTEVLRERETYYAYSGCLEPRGFDEPGEKGFYMGEVGNGVCRLDFMPISKRKYRELQIDITGLSSPREVLAAITTGMEGKEDIYKFVLTGKKHENVLRFDEILRELKNLCFYAQIEDKTKEPALFDELRKEKNLLGIYLSSLMEELESAPDEEKETIKMAMELGYRALSGQEVASFD